MGILAILCYVVCLVFAVASLVCFVMVVMEMFKRQQTGIAIATLIGIPCGYGGLLALIYGWMKATEWNIKKLMLYYTGATVGFLVFYGCGLGFGAMAFSSAAGDFNKQMQEIQKKQEEMQKKAR